MTRRDPRSENLKQYPTPYFHFLIVVGLSPQPKNDPNYVWFNASLEALDYAALGKLLSE